MNKKYSLGILFVSILLLMSSVLAETWTISDDGITGSDSGTFLNFNTDSIDVTNGTFSNNITVDGRLINTTDFDAWDAASSTSNNIFNGSVWNTKNNSYPATPAGIQSACDNIGNDGGTVYVPVGEYLFNPSLNLSETTGLKLVGQDAKRTILKSANGANCDVISIYNLTSRSDFSLTISGFIIMGNHVGGNTQGSGINITGDVATVWIEKCSISDCPEYGVRINGVGSYEPYNIRIIDSAIYKNEDDNIYVYDASHTHVRDCKISESTVGCGFHGNSIAKAYLSNNMFIENDEYGVYLEGGDYGFVTINGGIVSYSGQHGVVLSSRHNIVDGVNFQQNGQDAVNTYYDVYVNMYDNVVSDCTMYCDEQTKYGVCVGSSGDYSTVDNNVIRDANTSAYFFSSSATRSLVNGVGQNAGDPNSAGDWNGYGEFGITVFDTSNDKFYSYNGTGWNSLN